MMNSLLWIFFMINRFLSFREKGFNWHQPDHFRIVYLPDIRQLDKGNEEDERVLFATYKQG